jgi:ribosomal protein S18 acetylase RimI-like enzyme
MLPEELTITIADVTDAEMLTVLGITIFRVTFGPQNRQEDMDKYVAQEMNYEKIAAELADTQNTFFIARLNDIAVGYAKVRHNTEHGLVAVHPLEIERLYVLHEYHDRKIGAALMQGCIATAKERGCDVVWLGVWEHNDRAISFYKKWGFEFFGSHIFTLGTDDQTDVLMRIEVKG